LWTVTKIIKIWNATMVRMKISMSGDNSTPYT
jgi:hypothetical protein